MSKQKRGTTIPMRLIITAVIILIEIFIIVLAIETLSGKALWIYTAAEFISIFTVIHIANSRGNQSYKIMWIIYILLIPLLGVITYMLWGGGRMFPHLKRKMKKCSEEYIALLPSSETVKSTLNYSDMIHFRQAEYLTKESGYPVYSGTSSEFFSPGEKLMPALLSELEKAEKYIYLEFFILAEGYMWDQIFAILKKKAAQGLEIKVIFDDFGSIKYQSKNFITNLKKSGIEVSVFNPIRPSINIFMNNRNHRKIIVIDGKVAMTGGMNIGDEYINKIEKHGYWMDSAVIIKGNAVDSFLNMFCTMWKFITSKTIDFEAHRGHFTAPGNGFYIPYCDDPLNDKNPAEGVYMQILNNAQKYVYIATPYLILDSNMINTLCLAAKSGVDVRIVTPSVPDKWYVHPVTQYYYDELLEAGVRIYEYTPGFIHSKLFLSDDNIATVGTINIDYRSFYLHFECGLWMSGTDTIKDIKENFNSIISVSKEILPEKWKKRPISSRIKQGFLHLLAPFM